MPRLTEKREAKRNRGRQTRASQLKSKANTSSTPPHRASSPTAPDPANEQPIVGGMSEGCSPHKTRVSGTEPPTDDTSTYSIPFNSKSIIAQRYGTSPKAGRPLHARLIFTHGAGGGISNPATSSFMTGFSSEGTAGVCFQGSMNLSNRVKCFGAVIESEGVEEGVALGGRSMGARAAVMTCKEQGWERGRLVLVSYPLVSPKGDVRDEILLGVERGVDVLFVSGKKDSMMDWERLKRVRREMKARSWVVVVKGADHGMGLTGKAKKGVESMREETGRMAAEWLEGGRDEGKEWTKFLGWDEVQEKCILASSETDDQSGDHEKGGDWPKKAAKGGRGKSKSTAHDTEPDRSANPPAKRRKKAR